jgi:hypothetical protein
MKGSAWPTLICALLALSGCASDVVRSPVEFSALPAPQQKRYVASQAASIRLDSGYERSISAGTEFLEIGRIRQGSILKPTNTTFTIEGAHMHEAYPVLSNQRIVGFYLPVERAFSPLSQTTSLFIDERKP